MAEAMIEFQEVTNSYWSLVAKHPLHLARDGGRVLLDGRDVTAVPTHRRELGMVFQNFALFPHMTVRDNVGFPLMIRNVPKAEREKMVTDALRPGRPGGQLCCVPRARC